MMKCPKEKSETGSEVSKTSHKHSMNKESKIFEENQGGGNSMEPNSSALIPPWIRNSLGICDKGLKSNNKSSRLVTPSHEKPINLEVNEVKMDPNSEISTNINNISPASSIIEVNIGHEADFPDYDRESCGMPSTTFRSRNKKCNQYECNIFSVSNDKRTAKPVKSDVTCIDVIIPADDLDEKNKLKSHRGKHKLNRRNVYGTRKSEDISKGERDGFCRPTRDIACAKTDNIFSANSGKPVDARLLLLCGKKKIDDLTEADISLLQEMKNQIGHKEGLEKVFSNLKVPVLYEKSQMKDVNIKDRIEEKDENIKKLKKEIGKTSESSIMRMNQLDKMEENEKVISLNSKANEEERKYSDDIKRWYEKKKQNFQSLSKCCIEVEGDNKSEEKYKTQRIGDRKNKLRSWEHNVIEKAVSETLHRFIDLYGCKIPSDLVVVIKRNIIQTLENEYPEFGRNGDAMNPVKSDLCKADEKSLSFIFPEEVKKVKSDNENKVSVPLITDPVLSNKEKEISETECEETLRVIEPDENGYRDKEESAASKNELSIFEGKVREEKVWSEFEQLENEKLVELKKDFDECLHLLRSHLNACGTKFCNLVLEKNEPENSGSKLRIMYSFKTGLTKIHKIIDEKVNRGSAQGDSTYNKVCGCQRMVDEPKVTPVSSQSCQTKRITMEEMGIQTEGLLDFSIGDFKDADIAPGVYKIVKAAELGRYYLSPGEKDHVSEMNVINEHCESPNYDEADKDNGIYEKSFSRETFISERGTTFKHNQRLRRSFKSDCLGLNNTEDEKIIRKSNNSLLNILTENIMTNDSVSMKEKNARENEVQEPNQESRNSENFGDDYHMGCVWLWNGKKMDPGVDLKDHVEDLLREKLKEILGQVTIRGSDTENSKANTKLEGPAYVDLEYKPLPEESEKNLEIRKTRATFCIMKEKSPTREFTPFIFSGAQENREFGLPVPPENATAQKFGVNNIEKTVREVGTQNSRHSISLLNTTKGKQKSKVCTIPKLVQHRTRRLVHKIPSERASHPSKNCLSFAQEVGEAKKVKLECREPHEMVWNRDSGSNTGSVQKCFSILSNSSSSSTDGPVRVKLIGIEVAKEKSYGDGESCEGFERFSEQGKFDYGEPTSKEKLGELPSKKHGYWELIENVLNRVNQKEKDSLWNDIRHFVKKKIGRDIIDEGAREVCIELEQDIPKFCKGKSGQAVVARGNYTRTEGDVEVELDLTLEDLERILRHRQRKLMRQSHKSKMSNSTETTEETLDGIDFNCGGGYVTPCEMSIIKGEN